MEKVVLDDIAYCVQFLCPSSEDLGIAILETTRRPRRGAVLTPFSILVHSKVVIVGVNFSLHKSNRWKHGCFCMSGIGGGVCVSSGSEFLSHEPEARQSESQHQQGGSAIGH